MSDDERFAVIRRCMDEIGRLKTENARLRTALEWYADEGNYANEFDAGLQIQIASNADYDRGERARAALKECDV